MSSIAKSINLKEITIENNPISLAGDCVSFLVSYLPLLVSLNQLQITEQVRRAAHAWRKSKENSDQNYKHLSSDVNSNIRREEIISNARTNWELIRSQQANIINGRERQANQIKKTIKSKLLISNNSSSSISTGSLSSNTNVESSSGGGGGGGVGGGLTGNNSIKMSRNVIDVVPKRQIAKLLRSISHENTSSIASERDIDIDSDYHLPPMIDQLVELPKSHNRSASSTRAQVDESDDFVCSDSDDPKSNFKSRVPTTPPINSAAISRSKPPSPIEIIIGVNESDDNNNNDKTHAPPLPPINSRTTTTSTAITANNVNINKSSSSSSSSSKNEPVASSCSSPNAAIIVIENSEGQSTSDYSYHPKTNEIARTPSPSIYAREPRATLTIIDIDNSSCISLQPAVGIYVETESNSSRTVVVKHAAEPVDSDKLSMTSKVSSKVSEPINSATSAPNEEQQQQQAQQQRQVHSSQTNHHARNRSGARKMGPPLVRSQTARNLSSHLNQNQATAGAGNQQSANLKKEPKKEIDKDREQGEHIFPPECFSAHTHPTTYE
jgi:hypothetical protein